jgi:hypothetical protein
VSPTQASNYSESSIDDHDEEEQMNSSDSRFLASSESGSGTPQGIAMYRVIDRSQGWGAGAMLTGRKGANYSSGSDSWDIGYI